MAPKQFIKYFEEDNRPQVKADVERDKGMGISIGRLREDTVYDYKFVGLSHNTDQRCCRWCGSLCRNSEGKGLYYQKIKERKVR